MMDLWILTHRRVGDLDQMRTLARVLQARVVEKQIRFRNAGLARTIPFLSLLLMDDKKSSPLTPPWPELVLVAEGAVGNIALEVRRRSGDRSKVVCLGRPRGRLSEFDLIITTPQFGLAAAPNVLELSLPLHRLDRPAMEKAAALLLPQLSHLPRPWIVVLVGGTSAPDVLDETAVTELAKEAMSRAKQQDGSLLVVTSPRTGEAAEQTLAQILGAQAHLCLWSKRKGDKPYHGYLQLADSFIVTSDSISMLTEAMLTGKTVEVFRLPQRLSLVEAAFTRLYRRNTWLLNKFWFNSGLFETQPQRNKILDQLGQSRGLEMPNFEAERERARTRVLALLSAEPRDYDSKALAQFTRC
jgi:mitochondrial fission protein ELM1